MKTHCRGTPGRAGFLSYRASVPQNRASSLHSPLQRRHLASLQHLSCIGEHCSSETETSCCTPRCEYRYCLSKARLSSLVVHRIIYMGLCAFLKEKAYSSSIKYEVRGFIFTGCYIYTSAYGVHDLARPSRSSVQLLRSRQLEPVAPLLRDI